MVHDSMLEEIWRVRAQLLKEHGGLRGYYKYLEKVHRAHEQFARRHKLKPEGPELWEIDASLRGRYPTKNGQPTRMTPFRRPDAILDEIQRVRQQLLKEHGGLDGLFKYIQKLERAHGARSKRKRNAHLKQKSAAMRQKSLAKMK
jgi:hypothetical protein